MSIWEGIRLKVRPMKFIPMRCPVRLSASHRGPVLAIYEPDKARLANYVSLPSACPAAERTRDAAGHLPPGPVRPLRRRLHRAVIRINAPIGRRRLPQFQLRQQKPPPIPGQFHRAETGSQTPMGSEPDIFSMPVLVKEPHFFTSQQRQWRQHGHATRAPCAEPAPTPPRGAGAADSVPVNHTPCRAAGRLASCQRAL